MARPIKLNADYFPHDSGMRNDPKIKALRRKFGMDGYAIWNMLLEVLTDSDLFEYELNDLNIELLAGDFDVDPARLNDIIDYCITLGLLKKSENNIFSDNMKETFDSVLKKRKTDRSRKDTEFSERKTSDTELIDTENTQRKGKESKGKEIKLKERKEPLTPSLLEFESFFVKNGYSKDLAQKAYNTYSSAGWKDTHGNEIHDWRAKCKRVWFKSENPNPDNQASKANVLMNSTSFFKRVTGEA